MESRAVLMMKMEIRPASKGSNGEGEGTLSESELVEKQTAWCVMHAIENSQLQHRDYDSTHVPSSPTSSSDGPSWLSLPKEADPVIKSFRVEAGTEGGAKDTVGIVSEVVD